MQQNNIHKFKETNYLIHEQELEWEMNKELQNAIYEGMPENLSCEEKAMYIYAKMCKMFKYDEGFSYKNNCYKVNYSSMFSEGHLKNITPTSKITCTDFCRLYVKAVNQLHDNIEANIIHEKNNDHFCIGISTENASAVLEAINLTQNKENTDKSNDLTRAKFGERLEGIIPVSDESELFEKALDKVYPMIQEKEENSMENLLNKIKKAPREEVTIEPLAYIQKLIDNCKKIGISSNEFSITLNNIIKRNFLGEKFDCSYLGQRKREKKDMWYKRIIWLREKEASEGKEKNSYLIDTESLDISHHTDDEMKKILNDRTLIYESEKRKMPEFVE